jgi:hypothetical protein
MHGGSGPGTSASQTERISELTFALHAFLGPNSPAVSNESLAADLGALFGNDEGFSLQWELLPFAKAPTLALRWEDWLARVAYEEGEKVARDGAYAREIVGESAPFDLLESTRRVRVVFGSDDDRVRTNEMVWLVDYLLRIEGVAVFDPQQGDIMT